MAEKFVLTAQLQLQAPQNVRQVVNNIQSQLQGVNVDVNVKNAAKAQKELKKTSNATKDVGKSADAASKEVKKMDVESKERISIVDNQTKVLLSREDIMLALVDKDDDVIDV